MTSDGDFFIGWDSRVPATLARFVVGSALTFVCVMLAAAMFLGRAVDRGAGDVVGELATTGVLEALPYPYLRAASDARHPDGHVVLLAGEGKYGIGDAAVRTLGGKMIDARGALVRRGDLDMLLVSADDGLRLSDATPSAASASVAPLGKWRVAGEICDGKCETGVMRPGSGIAHKACASLCVFGEVPPVFVAAAPVEGVTFMLLANADGGPAPAALRDLIAIPVTLEGEIERRGDLAVFRVDWSRAVAR